MVVAASSSSASLHIDLFNSIQIQPTVLLSCADHHKRIQKKRLNYSKRVIGALLGKVDAENNVLLVSNAFAVPFDEDHRNKKKPALFVDNDYIETIYQMFLRVNINEKIVGWYHTGDSMHASDDMITAAFTKYCSHPVVVVRINLADNPHQSTADNTTESIIADPHEDLQIDKLPCRGFVALPKIEDTNSRSNFELSNDRSSPHIDSRFSLQYLPISLNPEESEMVGIEQLLRHIKEDSSVSDFQKGMAKSLRVIKNLNENIDVMSKYLKRVSSGELRHNDEIIARIQRIWHRLPDISLMPQIHDSLSSAINDNYLHQYINSLTKASLGLNNLIENTIENRETMQERSVN